MCCPLKHGVQAIIGLTCGLTTFQKSHYHEPFLVGSAFDFFISGEHVHFIMSFQKLYVGMVDLRILLLIHLQVYVGFLEFKLSYPPSRSLYRCTFFVQVPLMIMCTHYLDRRTTDYFCTCTLKGLCVCVCMCVCVCVCVCTKHFYTSKNVWSQRQVRKESNYIQSTNKILQRKCGHKNGKVSDSCSI